MAQQPYMVLHRYYYHIYQMFSQVDFNAHVGGTAIAPAADLLVQGTSAVPLLAFDQAHWRRSKLSTAGRGISESGPSEHAACGGGDDCATNLKPQLTPGLRLSHSSRIQPHKALHLCRISPPVSRWRILR